MNHIMETTLIGLGVGIVGTGLGGLIAFFIKNPGKRFISAILGISSGLMLSIVCFDLLPEAFEMGQLSIAIAGIITGVVMIIGVDEYFPRIGKKHGSAKGHDFIKTGILLGVGVALHNFPEGLAIGSSFSATKELGIGISIVIALHNMPEGISMAAPMKYGGMSGMRALAYTILVGIPMGMGAFIGAMLGEISKEVIAFCLAFAGGTMLYITCGELIPKAHNLTFGRMSSIGFVCGFILGIVISMNL